MEFFTTVKLQIFFKEYKENRILPLLLQLNGGEDSAGDGRALSAKAAYALRLPEVKRETLDGGFLFGFLFCSLFPSALFATE